MTQDEVGSARREGEIALDSDPARAAPDAGIVFIGRIRSPWQQRSDCPRNLRQARERPGVWGRLEIAEPYRPGLSGLEAGHDIHMLYWMHEARRDLIVQHPRHRETATGVFALRSPVRPNPIAMARVRIVAVDIAAGTVTIDATDALDGTPLVDIKPYIASVDAPSA